MMIKKIIVALSLLMSATAFSQEMLTHVAGKWKVDLEETKKIPELIKMTEGRPEAQKTIINTMLEAASKAIYHFEKESFTMTFEGNDMKSGIKVIENTKDKLVFEAVNENPNIEFDEKQIVYIFKSGDHLLIRDNDKGKPVKMTPPMLLKRVK